MIDLSESQLTLVHQKIKEKGLTYSALEEELVDHYACLIEQEMANGYSFDQAFELILNGNELEQIPQIQAETISLLTYKSRIMKKVALSASLFILTSTFIFSFLQNNNFETEKEYADTMEIPTSTLNSNAVSVSKMDPPSRPPLDKSPTITSPFGMRTHPIHQEKKLHKGIDFRAPKGTPVYATADGIVEKVATKYGYGKLIILKHDEIYQTYYAQLSTFEVEEGQMIKKGDMIGKVGSSGLSTAPHLHYEVLKNGIRVNPAKYL